MDLLERAMQLDELGAAHSRARTGAGCVVLLGGEAGIGKTSVLDTFIGRMAAAEPSIPVLWGACDALFTPRPLGPLLDMLPNCGPALHALVEAGAERERIFTAFLDEVRDREPPPVVVLEDVHWADEATLDLLKFVGRRIRQTSALLLATYRDDEVGPTHPLRRVIGELPKDATRRIRLPLLSESAVAHLARRAGHSAEGLYALTGGNPFFLTEVLAGDSGRVPESVQDAVLARATQLSVDARDTLDIISMVPGRTEHWLLEAMLRGRAAGSIAECSAAGMLVDTSTTVAFRHELARRAWEEALGSVRAMTLHSRVLDVLLERGAAHIGFARLVYHADRAGLEEQVRHFAPAAAREASALGAHREAAAHYATALRYAGPLPGAERATLLEAHSYERYLIADLEEAVDAREAALILRRELDDRARAGSDIRWLSRLAWFQGQRRRAVELGHDAVQVLEPLGQTAELAMAYSNLAQLAMLADELEDAVTWGERAIALAEPQGDVETLAHALNNVGTARLYAGQEQSGLAQMQRALSLAIDQGFHEHAVRAYTNLACHAVNSRNYSVAEARIATALTFAAEHDIDTFTLYLLGWRARLHLERGEWAEAQRDADSVLERYHVLDVVRFSALTVLGLLRARRGESGSEPLLDEAGALATKSGEMQRIAPATTARAEAAWIRGDMASTLNETRAAYAQALRCADPWYRGPIAYWLGRMEGLDAPSEPISEPYRLQLAGDWPAAAAAWARIGCPYERALALAEMSDPASQREALDELEHLGARGSADAVRRDLRARGVRGIPRGPRAATRRNPGGLTRSQLKVLALLAQGASNADIARQLFLSPRTVDHHVSAILQRLGVRTRAEAIAAAHTRRLLREN